MMFKPSPCPDNRNRYNPYTKEATDVHFSVLKPGTPEEKEMNLERSGKLVGGFRVRV